MGTSAGALTGSLYCAGYSPRQVRSFNNSRAAEWNLWLHDRQGFILATVHATCLLLCLQQCRLQPSCLETRPSRT